MNHSSYCVKAPGKLMIAGEYAVLEPGQRAVVIAVNRYVTAFIEPRDKNSLSLPQWGLENIEWKVEGERVQFSVSDPRLNFIRNSIAVTNQFLQEKGVSLQSFNLKINSELNEPLTGKKYGLGSSAAVVVAVITAILRFHSGDKKLYTLDQIFKLSSIAHLKTQKNGSGADVAAAVYGGWLEYSAYRPKWILNELKQEKKLIKIIDKPWPDLTINLLTPPSSLKLVVGWTKEPASTAPMVKKVQEFREHNLELYNEFLRESFTSVSRLISSFDKNDYIEAIKSISQNRKVLQELGDNAGVNIETSKLKKLSSIAERYGSGKSSGAGGGDCGIVFLDSDNKKEELFKQWKEADIQPLDLKVSKIGVYPMTNNSNTPACTGWSKEL